MFKESMVYNDKNVADAKKKIAGFFSNMGGTNMIDPLLAIYSTPVKATHLRNIFMLTDGAI